MGYREVGLMQVVEVLRRWRARESIRAIAQATGLARNSVRRYVRAAEDLGLAAEGPPPANEQLLVLARLGETAPAGRAAPQHATLEAQRDRIAQWVGDERLQ